MAKIVFVDDATEAFVASATVGLISLPFYFLAKSASSPGLLWVIYWILLVIEVFYFVTTLVLVRRERRENSARAKAFTAEQAVPESFSQIRYDVLVDELQMRFSNSWRQYVLLGLFISTALVSTIEFFAYVIHNVGSVTTNMIVVSMAILAVVSLIELVRGSMRAAPSLVDHAYAQFATMNHFLYQMPGTAAAAAVAAVIEGSTIPLKPMFSLEGTLSGHHFIMAAYPFQLGTGLYDTRGYIAIDHVVDTPQISLPNVLKTLTLNKQTVIVLKSGLPKSRQQTEQLFSTLEHLA